MPSPAFDDDLGFAQRVEDLAVEQLVAQAGVKALDEPVLPWAARRDVSGLCSDRTDPFLDCIGEEFRAVVRANVLGHATQDEQIGQDVDDVDRFEPARHANGEAFVGELVDDVEQADFAPVMDALLEKVVGPNVVGALGPQPDARPIVQP